MSIQMMRSVLADHVLNIPLGPAVITTASSAWGWVQEIPWMAVIGGLSFVVINAASVWLAYQKQQKLNDLEVDQQRWRYAKERLGDHE